jgi:hypothetical protein
MPWRWRRVQRRRLHRHGRGRKRCGLYTENMKRPSIVPSGHGRFGGSVERGDRSRYDVRLRSLRPVYGRGRRSAASLPKRAVPTKYSIKMRPRLLYGAKPRESQINREFLRFDRLDAPPADGRMRRGLPHVHFPAPATFAFLAAGPFHRADL